jgi:hypothetical protein
MSNVLFISEQFLKDNTVINDNVEFKQLRPVIMAAQDMQIQEAIGSALFAELKAQVIASTVTSLNNTLITDYIQPALLYWCLAEAPLVITYKLANKGMVTHNSENQSPASMNEVNYMAKQYRAKAEWYTNRITEYLLLNEQSYPLFMECPPHGIAARQNQFTTSLFIGDKPTTKRLAPIYNIDRL